jgi:hypothetical protein
MKLMSMVNMADMRILELPSESGTYKNLELVVQRITDIYMAKPTQTQSCV